MQPFRVYFATKFHVKTSWFRHKKDVAETEYVVVTAHNEAHAVKLAKEYVPLEALGMPFQVTQIRHAEPGDTEGYHGTLTQSASIDVTETSPDAPHQD